MSTKEEPELQECQISSVHPVAAHLGRAARSASIALSSTGSWRDPTRSWGWLLSGAVLINVIVLGCAFVGASVFNAKSVTAVHLELYLVVLIVSTTAWMVFYKAYTSRGDEAVLYKDFHAGPVWLRGGLVLFGLCSLIMDVFRITNSVGRIHCENTAVKIVFPAVQGMFVLVQTYFLWLHAKDCVQAQRNITRSGLMLTLATNLMIWITAVTEESLHKGNSSATHSLDFQSPLPRATASDANSSCVCNMMACDIFKKAIPYLYPFNIEYSLFASAMAYVMWKNVGRLVDDHGHHEHRFSMRDVLIGPALGIIVLVAGLTIFVVYQVDVSVPAPNEKREPALIMYYVANTTTVVLMSVASAVGCALFQLEQREHAVGKNPTRSLDMGLLIGASVGQLTVSYFTIVAVLADGVGSSVKALNLAWSVLLVVELCVQNVFIIEGLRREPHQDTRRASIFSNLLALQALEERRMSGNVLTPRGSIALPAHKPLPWKRKALKEISSFLLLCNIILWIIPAFGARPEFDNPLGEKFYKLSMWEAVVNIGLPFGIFYRMHSVASLLEVYLTS
ncbi:proton channel OTOP2 [Clarias gariepinus]|nr:proton channel OTOP2 isoform X2 [Clarias gariepinus]